MGSSENSLANVLTVCVMGFFAGCLALILSVVPFIPGGFRLMGFGLILMLASGLVGGTIIVITHFARNKAVTKGRTGPRSRLAVKIFTMYRTDRGSVVSPDSDELTKPRYHMVLMTPDEKRREVETDAALWHRCSEGMWGYAEVQGDWLGAFAMDAELYDKHSRR